MGTTVLSTQTRQKYERFALFAWGVLAYNILVVLWGAFVRATGSGAGCGSHWPLCNGSVVPRAPSAETIIEFTHRLTSGLSLVAVAVLVAWAFRLFPHGHLVRRAAVWSGVFLVIEALLGAGLVLFRFVAQNDSTARAAYLSAHLANTQLLLAMLAATAWFVLHDAPRRRPGFLLAALAVALMVSITGAVAALGDTLFPAATLAEGVRQELAATAHALLRLRLLHPVLAVLASGYLLMAALVTARGHSRLKPAAGAVALLVAIQLAAGVINVLLLAPVWLQIVHLLLADLLWVALVLLYLDAAALKSPPAGPV